MGYWIERLVSYPWHVTAAELALAKNGRMDDALALYRKERDRNRDAGGWTSVREAREAIRSALEHQDG